MADPATSSNFDVSEIIEAIRAVIETGSKTPIATILSVIILVSAVGFFLFRRDVSHYRALVFLVIAVMAGFILFDLSIDSNPPDTLGQEIIGDDSFVAHPEANRSERYLPTKVYGRGVYIGMSEAQLRDVREWLPASKLELNYSSFGSARIDQTLLAIRTDIQVDGLNGIEVTYAFNDGKLAAASSTFQCSARDHCIDVCREAEKILSEAFSPDSVMPRWQGNRTTEDRRSSSMVIETTSSTAERRSGDTIAWIARYYQSRYIRGTNSGEGSFDAFVSCGTRAYLFDNMLDKS